MAFQIQNFARNSDANNTGKLTLDSVEYNGPALFTYQSGADNAAAIAAANYFADAVYNLAEGDIIMGSGSDASFALMVDAIDRAAKTITTVSMGLTGSVGTANIDDLAVTTAKLADDAVTNDKLADDSVSLENLDAGIAPSHVVKYAGQHTTVGGAAAEEIVVTGAAATDLAFVQVVNNGTGSVTVLLAVVTLNTLTVTFSADPQVDTIVNYQLLRAAA